MTPREEWLSDSLQRYLDRRSMPQGFKDKQQAIRDEIQALAKTLFRLAPVNGYQDWWDDFSERLAEDAKTRAWPTQGEMSDAAKAIRKSGVQPLRANDEAAFNPAEVAAKRIRAKEPVGEEWIYGRCCVEMMDAHMITDADLAPYRSALFFADREIIDEETAIQRERERKERHRQALRRTWIGDRSKKNIPQITGAA